MASTSRAGFMQGMEERGGALVCVCLKRRAIVRTICDYPGPVPFGEIAGRRAPEPFM